MRLMIGKVPIMYIPRYTQRLDRKPLLVMTPGYSKNWGSFLLTQWRYQLNPHIKTTVSGDFRELKGVAEGIGVKYDIPGYGDGIIKTYYMNELNIMKRHFWLPKTGETIYRERFRAAWRHLWKIDNRTTAIWQYYKLSDKDLLKDYFEREHDRDLSPATFALVTHNFKQSTLSFQSAVRVNRFESIVERIPEIRFDYPTIKIGDTGFYWKERASSISSTIPIQFHRDYTPDIQTIAIRCCSILVL